MQLNNLKVCMLCSVNSSVERFKLTNIHKITITIFLFGDDFDYAQHHSEHCCFVDFGAFGSC